MFNLNGCYLPRSLLEQFNSWFIYELPKLTATLFLRNESAAEWKILRKGGKEIKSKQFTRNQSIELTNWSNYSSKLTTARSPVLTQLSIMIIKRQQRQLPHLSTLLALQSGFSLTFDQKQNDRRKDIIRVKWRWHLTCSSRPRHAIPTIPYFYYYFIFRDYF